MLMPVSTLDDHITVRPFAPEADFPALAGLLAAVEAADLAGDEVSEEALRQRLAWPSPDPARDRLVVAEPGRPDRLIGYGAVWKSPLTERADIECVIHPAWRRRGLGTALLARLLERVRELGASAVGVYADEGNAQARSFLERRGFRPVAAYTRLLAPAATDFPAPGWPAGYQLRDYDAVRHLPTLTAALNRCYEGLWGHQHLSDDDVVAWLPELISGNSPTGILLLFAPDGGVAGICRVELKTQTGRGEALEGAPLGYIDGPGVAPEYRHLRLHRPLLLAGARWLRERGAGELELESWGDQEQTLDLYREHGFAVSRRAISYGMQPG